MVAAFTEENNLATIIGAKTPGRLLSGSAFKAGFGYIVGLPVAAYLTWQGKLIEGRVLQVFLRTSTVATARTPKFTRALKTLLNVAVKIWPRP